MRFPSDDLYTVRCDEPGCDAPPEVQIETSADTTWACEEHRASVLAHLSHFAVRILSVTDRPDVRFRQEFESRKRAKAGPAAPTLHQFGRR